MVDNQHRKISGYRELSEKEIALMNQVKAIGRQLSDIERKLQAEDTDKRWINIGTTDIQKGLMAWTRSVAKPDFF